MKTALIISVILNLFLLNVLFWLAVGVVLYKKNFEEKKPVEKEGFQQEDIHLARRKRKEYENFLTYQGDEQDSFAELR